MNRAFLYHSLEKAYNFWFKSHEIQHRLHPALFSSYGLGYPLVSIYFIIKWSRINVVDSDIIYIRIQRMNAISKYINLFVASRALKIDDRHQSFRRKRENKIDVRVLLLIDWNDVSISIETIFVQLTVSLYCCECLTLKMKLASFN